MAPTYKNFIYMEAQGFIFAYVPKVACTNWKMLLRQMNGAPDWRDKHLAHDRRNGGLRYLDLADAADAALLQDPGIRRYAMVRDPYSRTLSAYLNKVESRLPVQPETEGEEHFRKVVRDIDGFRHAHLDTAVFPKITFEVFLRWLKDSGSWHAGDEHWAPQSTILRPDDVSYDIIGRFETIPADSLRLLEAMGCDEAFPAAGSGPPPTHAEKKMNRYTSVFCIDTVTRMYRDDFISFEYKQSWPL